MCACLCKIGLAKRHAEPPIATQCLSAAALDNCRQRVSWICRSVCRHNCRREVKLIPKGVNFGSFREIRAFVDDFHSRQRPLHLLVLNAAIQGAPLW